MIRLLVAAYLAAIVIANLVSAQWGPDASIVNAAAMIGFVLIVRDRLHDAWQENRLRNMTLLIGAGSVLSYVASLAIHGDAPHDVIAKIALGSFLAFAAAESTDAITYHLLRARPWLERSNNSNIASAIVDSNVFVWVSFGWGWKIVFGQICAKVAGGYVWSLILRKRREKLAYA